MPQINHQKTRTARLLTDFYPDLPVYAMDAYTLVMPYFEQAANAQEIIQEAIRIFIQHRRIVADMCRKTHFQKDANGKVYCTEPDLTYSVARRLSQGSYFIEQKVVGASLEQGQRTPYQQLLHTAQQSSKEDSKLAHITMGLLYLDDVIDDCYDIDNSWINEDWLELVYIFSTTHFPLELSDLNVMHDFGPLVRRFCHDDQQQIQTGYRIYYRCMEYFILQSDEKNLRIFLHTLAAETVEAVFAMAVPRPLLSVAVLAKNPTVISLLLEFDAAPLLADNNPEAYNAIDWAIFNGSWDSMVSLLNAEPRTVPPAVNPYVLWPNTRPNTRISREEAVAAMRELAEATQFQQRLKIIRDLALAAQSQTHLNGVHALIRNCKTYLENQDRDLVQRKKIFIQNCNRLLRQPLPALSSDVATNTMQTAIRELKNALSLARDPTYSCVIS